MRLESEVIRIKERNSMLFLRRGRVDVENGAFVREQFFEIALAAAEADARHEVGAA